MEGNTLTIALICIVGGVGIIVFLVASGKRQQKKLEEEKRASLMEKFDQYRDILNDPENVKSKLLAMTSVAIENNMNLFERKKKLIAEFDSWEDKIKDRDELRKDLISKSTDELEAIIKGMKRQLYLINKYGQEEGMKLYDHKYWIGMTEAQVLDAKGNPTKIETEVLKTKTKKILIYGTKSGGDVFTIVDGLVERFSDR